MCGIVAAVAERNVQEILLEGLKRLEYRGYDSAGMTVFRDGALSRHRALGKVAVLAAQLAEVSLPGFSGIAHTRGQPMANHLKPMHTRTTAVTMLPWYITVLSKITKPLRTNCKQAAIGLPRKPIPK